MTSTIKKKYVDETGWFEISFKDFIMDAEKSGHWLPGTSFKALKEANYLRLPFAEYRLEVIK